MPATDLPTAATFAALDAHEARRQAAALELAAARAEYAVLDHYDAVRQALGHDYGNGQRHAELIRRGRELERLEAAAGDAAPALNAPGAYDAARQAAERLLRPRLRRLDREGYRAATPATRRTRTALEATLDRYRNPLYHGPRA